ncbi:MAG: GNAT family N-acetyltransferase [Terriglobales bacterium]
MLSATPADPFHHATGKRMKFHRIDIKSADWKRLDAFTDRTVFQTREWLQFVAESQRAQPVLAELREKNDVLGYFTGLTVSKFGMKVLGSSFPGWTTPYIGFNLNPNVSRALALAALEKFAWDDLKCLHLEVSDPNFSAGDGEAAAFKLEYYASYRTDLSRSEEELFNAMESACRRCIRKAEKSGLKIEEAHDLAFADEYFEQLKDVFAKQSLVPTYSVERVRSLVRHLEPSGNILLLRARDPEGKCIATGIYPGFNQIAEFWGNASFRAYQGLRPNEACHWYAMRYWKQRGVAIFDWGGEGAYKEKYGCQPHRVPWFTKSRYQIVGALRNAARNLFARKQKFLGWLQGNRSAAERVPAEE